MKQAFLAKLSPVFVYTVFAIPLSFPDAHHIGFILLTAWGLIAVFQVREKIPAAKLTYAIALAFYFLIPALSHLYYQLPARNFENPAHFLIIIPALLASMPRIEHKHLLYACMLGSLGSGIVASIDIWIHKISRVEGWQNSIDFAGIALILSAITLAGCKSVSHKKFILYFALISATLGIMACVFTESRGPWLSIPLILIVLFWQNRASVSHWFIRPHRHFIGYAILAILFVLCIPTIQKQIVVTQVSINKYQEGQTYTSSGVRLDMWKNALRTFSYNPLFGVGQSGAMELIDKHIEEGFIPAHIKQFNVAHNQYLDQLARFGILGFLCLMGILLVPLVIFYQRAATYPAVEFPAVAGMLLILILSVCMLTQSSLMVNAVVNFFLASSVLLIHLSQPVPEQAVSETPSSETESVPTAESPPNSVAIS